MLALPSPRYVERTIARAPCPAKFSGAPEVDHLFAEEILTVVASCRQQGRPLLAFLVAAGEAAGRGSPPPSLLPTTAGGLNGYALALLAGGSRTPRSAAVRKQH